MSPVTNNAETTLPPAPPGYVWAQPTQPPPPWKPPRWLKAVTVAWVAVLLAGALYYSFHGQDTVRGQTTITQAQPVVDRAIADVVHAAGPKPVIAISEFNRVSSCSITPLRKGFNYQRTVTFYGAPGAEASLLRAIAAGLPARYVAKASGTQTVSLYADAGDFVAVSGTRMSPGQVLVRASTGCRTMGGDPTSVEPPSTPSADISDALSALPLKDPTLARTQVACSNGHVLVTDSATMRADHATGALDAAAGRLSTNPVLRTDNVFAYRTAKSDVVVLETPHGVTVTSTTRC
jgi:hypothetical protein